MKDPTSLKTATAIACACVLLGACRGQISGGAGGGAATDTGSAGSGGTVTGQGGAAVAPQELTLGATGLHRLSRIEYDNTLRDLLGDTTRPGFAKLPEDVNDPFDNDYTTQLVSGALVADVEALATDVSARTLADPARKATLVGCTPTGPSDKACMTSFVKAFGRRAFRRPLTDDEVTGYVGLQSFAVEAGDFYAGVDLVVRAMLQDPSFLYRVEIGAPVTGRPGLTQLGDYEIGTRLSYFLWGTMPSDELLDLAAAGMLATPAGRRAAATKMLSDARGADRVRAFHGFWLGYHQLPVDAALGDQLRAETDALVTRVVLEKKADYLELFRWPETFLTDSLAMHYGLPAPGSTTGAWVDYQAMGSPRRGILSHGAVLATGAKFDDTSPTLRGVFVRNRLLCQTIPAAAAERHGRPAAGRDGDRLQGRSLRRAPRGRLRRLPQPDGPHRLRPRELRSHGRLPRDRQGRAPVRDLGRRAGDGQHGGPHGRRQVQRTGGPRRDAHRRRRSRVLRRHAALPHGVRAARDDRRRRGHRGAHERLQDQRPRLRRPHGRRRVRSGLHLPTTGAALMALRITRRSALKGLGGVAIALPALDVMFDRHGEAYAQGQPIPKRYLVCFGGQSLGGDGDPLHNDYVPNTIGPGYDLKSALAPLAGVQSEVSVVSGLSIPTANGGAVPTAGRRDDFHVSSLSPLLAGIRSPTDTSAAGPTSDQIVAAAIAGNTPFKSLVYRVQVDWYLGVSAAYGRDMISYKAAASGKPMPIVPVVSPHDAFTALFSNFTPPSTTADQMKQDFLLRSRKSVLDLVGGKLQKLAANTQLGKADQLRLQQHGDEIRALENQISALPPAMSATCQKPTDPGMDSTPGGPRRAASTRSEHRAPTARTSGTATRRRARASSANPHPHGPRVRPVARRLAAAPRCSSRT